MSYSDVRILILGSTGLLGQALVRYCQLHAIAYLGVSSSTQPAVDVTQPEIVRAVIEPFQPTHVINTVALVNLAQCEANPELAKAINATPAEYLAQWAQEYGYQLVQISTDHYYTGDGTALHTEDAPVTLLNEYARTKHQSEQFALEKPESLVVRTNIVGFRGKASQPTFAEWAIETLAQQKPLTLFHDFYTSSIDVTTFSTLLFDLIEKNTTGLINLASRDVASKQQFVTALARALNLSADYAEIGSIFDTVSPVQRAESLGLDVSKAEALLGYPCPTLEDVTAQLAREYQALTSQNKGTTTDALSV